MRSRTVVAVALGVSILTITGRAGQAPVPCTPASETPKPWDRGGITVHPGHHYLMHRDGTPFFWLADTAWPLWSRLDRDEMVRYMDSRAARGFNVLQVMALHDQAAHDWKGDPALQGGDPSKPVTTPGNDPADAGQYGFWDHVDYAFDLAAERGMYIAMVPAWNTFIQGDDPPTPASEGTRQPATLNTTNVAAYMQFLIDRYGKRPNVIWLNGGDVMGDRAPRTFRMIGSILKEKDPEHLVTFHPYGRERSSRWFHEESWLDLNMFQSGHRRYEQDPAGIGQDNWWYVEQDWALRPPKPVLDGEPSYEALPQGLHDGDEPRWQPADARRYAYWGVFAGGAGHTYGHAALMAMNDTTAGPNRRGKAVDTDWREAIDAEGGNDMIHLKRLMLSRPYFERVPAQDAVVQQLPTRVVPGAERVRRQQEAAARMTPEKKMAAAMESNRRTAPRLERVAATRGPGYLMVYSYTSAPFTVRLGGIAAQAGGALTAWWYNPRTGDAIRAKALGALQDEGLLTVDPPGDHRPGNDWVLVLDDASAAFLPPGGFVRD
jgi:hypothetical protein